MTNSYSALSDCSDCGGASLNDIWADLGLTNIKQRAIDSAKQKTIEASLAWSAEHPFQVRTASAFSVIMVIGAVGGLLAFGYITAKR